MIVTLQEKNNEFQKNEVNCGLHNQFFLLVYIDFLSLSGITGFIGLWQIACPIHLQNSEQVRLSLTQEQSAILHPVLQSQLMRLSTSSGAANCPGGVKTGQSSNPFFSQPYSKSDMPAAFHNAV